MKAILNYSRSTELLAKIWWDAPNSDKPLFIRCEETENVNNTGFGLSKIDFSTEEASPYQTIKSIAKTIKTIKSMPLNFMRSLFLFTNV